MSGNSRTKRNSNHLLSDRAATIASDVHEVRAAARKVAADGVEAIRDTAHQYLDEGRQRVRSVGDNLHTKLEEQPVKALLLAAGIGFLLGAIWTRR